MKAAKQMVFIIEEKQFVGSLKGAVPVLIQQVFFLVLKCLAMFDTVSQTIIHSAFRRENDSFIYNIK
jgi:hypothetical protein